MRRVVDDPAASTHAIGELLLEVAPAYLSDHQAADTLALFCDEIGIDLDHGLAARRYALTSEGAVVSNLMDVFPQVRHDVEVGEGGSGCRFV
ncbi:hypothetical protein ACWCXX_37850 [Streptomyces sp. NPDC001732]